MKTLFDTLDHVARVLDGLGAPYAVVGSVASSLYGDARATADVDIVADLRAEHVARIVASLENDFYIDEQAVRRAISSRRLFNVIDFESLLKVDVYVAPDDPFTRQQLIRRRPEALLPGSARKIYLASPEDTLLAKLRWFRQGGEASPRQLTDAVGILKIQGESLDIAYSREWAERLGVLDLLEQALDAAGA
jgi:hypothetical protein